MPEWFPIVLTVYMVVALLAGLCDLFEHRSLRKQNALHQRRAEVHWKLLVGHAKSIKASRDAAIDDRKNVHAHIYAVAQRLIEAENKRYAKVADDVNELRKSVGAADIKLDADKLNINALRQSVCGLAGKHEWVERGRANCLGTGYAVLQICSLCGAQRTIRQNDKAPKKAKKHGR
jgi:hypothetical protein